MYSETQGPSNFSLARTLIYSLFDSTSLWGPEKQTLSERAGLEISIWESSAKVVAEAVGSNTIYHLVCIRCCAKVILHTFYLILIGTS